MRYPGSSIRAIESDTDTIIRCIRDYARAQGFEIHEDEQNIITYNNKPSFLQLWWHCSPQIIKWSITKEYNETKVEIIFSLFPKFKLWFWSILIPSLIVSLKLLNYASESLPLNSSSQSRTALILTITGSVLFIFTYYFATRIITSKNYTELIEDFWGLVREKLKKTKNSLHERILKSDYQFPETLQILGVFLIIGSFSLITSRLDVLSNTFLQISVMIIIILFLLVYFSIKYEGFEEKLDFTLMAFAIPIHILFLYNLVYGFGIVDLKEAFSIHEGNLVNQKGILTRYFFGSILIYTIFFSMLFSAPEIAEQIKKYIDKCTLDKEPTSPHYKSMEPGNLGKSFTCWIIISWTLFSIFIYTGILNSFSVFFFIFFKFTPFFNAKNILVTFDSLRFALDYIFPTADNNLKIKALVLAYTLPLFSMIAIIAYKRGKFVVKRKKAISYGLRIDQLGAENMKKFVREVTEKLNINSDEVYVLILPDELPKINTHRTGLFNRVSVINITRGLLKLKDDEIKGLIAHELFHISRHSWKYHFLCFLSDITLMGSGFLAFTTNSFNDEFEADNFVKEIFHHDPVMLEQYENALKKLAVSSGRSTDKSIRSRLVEKINSIKNKTLARLRTTFELYYADRILSYIHPSLDERIERLRK